MASSLFNPGNLPKLGRNTQPNANDMQSQFQTFLGQYGNCDPMQQLNSYVSQGKIKQQDYDWAIQTAQRMMPVLSPILKMFGR